MKNHDLMKNILPFLEEKIITVRAEAKKETELLELNFLKRELQPSFPGVPKNPWINLNSRLAFLTGVCESDTDDMEFENGKGLEDVEAIIEESTIRKQVVKDILAVYSALPEISSDEMESDNAQFLNGLNDLKLIGRKPINIEDCASIFHSQEGSSYSFSYKGLPILCKYQNELDLLMSLWDEEYSKRDPNFIEKCRCVVSIENVFDESGSHKVLNFEDIHHFDENMLDTVALDAEMFFQNSITQKLADLKDYILN